MMMPSAFRSMGMVCALRLLLFLLRSATGFMRQFKCLFFPASQVLNTFFLLDFNAIFLCHFFVIFVIFVFFVICFLVFWDFFVRISRVSLRKYFASALKIKLIALFNVIRLESGVER